MPTIDRLLPRWDVASRHETEIRATAGVVYGMLRTLDIGQSWAIRTMFRLRGLPASALTIDALQQIRFAVLSDEAPRELVLGLIGRFWTSSGDLVQTNSEHFEAFDESGYAKAVWNFSVRDGNDGTVILATETRVLCLDEKSRKRFRRYWFVIRPFSGWIRKLLLRLVKDSAERVKTRGCPDRA